MAKEIGEKRLPEKDGVIFLIFQHEKVLLEDRITPEKPYFGYIIIPGGKKENTDASLEEAAEREALEECNIKVKKMIHLDTFLHVTISNNLYNTAVYLITEFEGELNNIEGKSTHLWASLDEAFEIMPFAESRYIITLAKQKLIEEGLIKD